MQHLFGLEWPRRGGGGVFQLGQEGGGGGEERKNSTDRLPSPFLREGRPGGRLIRDVEGIVS